MNYLERFLKDRGAGQPAVAPRGVAPADLHPGRPSSIVPVPGPRRPSEGLRGSRDGRPGSPPEPTEGGPDPSRGASVGSGGDRPARSRGERPGTSTVAELAHRPDAGVGIAAPMTVMLGDRPYSYSAYEGGKLAGGWLGFDTETALIEGVEVPELALAAASSGDDHRLIHPDRLGEFVLAHRRRHWVCHNAAFDFWVVADHLDRRGRPRALEAWWSLVEEGRMHDTMTLDGLIRLGRTDAFPRPRDLAEVAREYAGVEVDKSDPYRLRYGEIIGLDWTAVDRGFFEYAIKDPIVTRLAYAAMYPLSIAIMESHGYDPARLA